MRVTEPWQCSWTEHSANLVRGLESSGGVASVVVVYTHHQLVIIDPVAIGTIGSFGIGEFVVLSTGAQHPVVEACGIGPRVNYVSRGVDGVGIGADRAGHVNRRVLP